MSGMWENFTFPFWSERIRKRILMRLWQVSSYDNVASFEV
jgi:hypothetical protein